MGFLQIIDFHTDRIEEFIALERTWEVDSASGRTSTGGQLFADREHPGTTSPSTGSPTTTRRW